MKKLFEKAKADFKFRKAGEGHTLGDERTQPQASTSQGRRVEARRPPSASAQRAGQAALERISQQERVKERRPQSTQATWKHSVGTAQASPAAAASMAAGSATALDYERMRKEVKQEMVAAQACDRQISNSSTETPWPTTVEPKELDAAPALKEEGVYFICPLCSASTKRSEMDRHMTNCLEIQYSTEPTLASATMIHTLNKDVDRVKACIDILCKYIDNICLHPGEEKFRKIKQGNRVFQEKVAPITGGVEFLAACGFEEKTVSPEEEKQETFYILPSSDEADIERLQTMKEILTATDSIKPTLDRNVKIYQASSLATKFDISPEFFALSSEEIKREYRLKAEEVDRNSQLRTKAMREADKRPSKKYRFTLIRIRFPDGILLQGTFQSRDRLRDVMEFVRGCLVSDWQPFFLSETCGQLTDEDAALSDLGLVPGAVLNFAWDPSVMLDIAAATGAVEQKDYLKPELLHKIQTLGQT